MEFTTSRLPYPAGPMPFDVRSLNSLFGRVLLSFHIVALSFGPAVYISVLLPIRRKFIFCRWSLCKHHADRHLTSIFGFKFELPNARAEISAQLTPEQQERFRKFRDEHRKLCEGK